jgi:hypothetical protein
MRIAYKDPNQMFELRAALVLGAILLPAAVYAQMPPPLPDPTRDQVKAMAGALFNVLDVNHDGVATREEAAQIKAQLPPGPPGGPPMDQLFAAVPFIAREQFDALMLAGFDKADANHDGVLSKQELAQAKASMPPMPAAGGQ